MARIELELPERFEFSTELVVRASDINYAGHVGNDAMISLLQEARVRLFEAKDLKEGDIDGVGIIIADAAVIYAAEAFRGDRLLIEVALRDFNKYGCDIVYRASKVATGAEVVRAKNGIVFFDYEEREVRPIPATFLVRFERR
jgi:acyl-CoA thioester hydrolase